MENLLILCLFKNTIIVIVILFLLFFVRELQTLVSVVFSLVEIEKNHVSIRVSGQKFHSRKSTLLLLLLNRVPFP